MDISNHVVSESASVTATTVIEAHPVMSTLGMMDNSGHIVGMSTITSTSTSTHIVSVKLNTHVPSGSPYTTATASVIPVSTGTVCALSTVYITVSGTAAVDAVSGGSTSTAVVVRTTTIFTSTSTMAGSPFMNYPANGTAPLYGAATSNHNSATTENSPVKGTSTVTAVPSVSGSASGTTTLYAIATASASGIANSTTTGTAATSSTVVTSAATISMGKTTFSVHGIVAGFLLAFVLKWLTNQFF
jgi:hypothetical protein